MKKIFLVDEDLNEFAKRGRPRKPKDEDEWYSADDEFDTPDPGPAQIENVELEDEVTDIAIIKQITKMLNNELKFPEFNRGFVKFKIRSTGELFKGIPLAKLGNGESFLFKNKKGMKKVKLSDMIMESYNNQQTYVSESFKDYE